VETAGTTCKHRCDVRAPSRVRVRKHWAGPGCSDLAVLGATEGCGGKVGAGCMSKDSRFECGKAVPVYKLGQTAVIVDEDDVNRGSGSRVTGGVGPGVKARAGRA